jgi:hypothetical protein
VRDYTHYGEPRMLIIYKKIQLLSLEVEKRGGSSFSFCGPDR